MMKAISIAIAAVTTVSIIAMFVAGAMAQPVQSLNEQVGWEELNTGTESSPNGWGQSILSWSEGTMSFYPFGSEPLNLRVRVAKSRTQPDGCAMVVVWVEAIDTSLPGAIRRREGSAYLCRGEAI